MKWRADSPVLLEKGDDRYEKEVAQIKDKGICDSELWSLDDTIVRFIVPRLREFYLVSIEHTQDDDFHAKISRCIECLSVYEAGPCTEEEMEIINEGLDLLREVFTGLWW